MSATTESGSELVLPRPVGAAYALVSAVRELIGRGPGFRANTAGLWFGGGRVVPARVVR